MQNEPNCPKRGAEAVSRLRIADWGKTRRLRPSLGQLCETNPILPAGGGAAAWNVGQMCKTNPISGGRPRPQQRIVQNEPNSARPGTANVQNEPNFPAAPGGTGPRPPLQEPIMQNKPNFRRSTKTRGADCAKRTQFGPATAGKRAKRTQFSRRCPVGRGLGGRGSWRAIMQNEAICPRCPEMGAPVGVRPPSGPIVRNEPNSHPRRGIGGASPTLQGGAIAPNEPNSARSGRQMRKTNPIFPAAPGGTDLQGHRTRDKCAKRSRFTRTGGTRRRWPKRQVSPPGTSMRSEPTSQGSSRRDGCGTCHCESLSRGAAGRQKKPPRAGGVASPRPASGLDDGFPHAVEPSSRAKPLAMPPKPAVS